MNENTKMNVIKKGNITYFERKGVILGDFKCKYCSCHFSSNYDLQCHLQNHWRETRSGNGEILASELDPVFASRVSMVGSLVEGQYRYVLLDGGKLIFRTREIVRY